MGTFPAIGIRGWGLAVLVLTGCSRAPQAPPAQAAAPQAAAQAPAGPASPNDSGHPRIVVLGDSLSAGYGLLDLQAYPALLQDKLNTEGYAWDVVNAGISGDTSAAGLQRVEWAMKDGAVRILILELGANDGLRGLPVSEMKKNLAAIIERAQDKRISVLLAGMEAPPNFGPEYTVSFRQVYRDLAKQYKVTLLPFLLDKVAGVPSLNQADGIHPNADGAQIVADTVWNVLKPMVDAATASSSSGGLRPPEPPDAIARRGPVPRFRLHESYGGRAEAPAARRRAAPAAHSLGSFAS
jgi:acyl-CoA thioesterase-1